MRKYLSVLNASASELSNKQLAEKAYNNDQLELNTQKNQLVFEHFKSAQADLHRTGVTRKLLWKEYLAVHPDGYGYSQYYYQLNEYLKHKDVTMHLEYKAAELLMIDFAGKKQHYVCPVKLPM